ncbi:MAG: peptide deformylase [Acidobacteriota bacterium]
MEKVEIRKWGDPILHQRSNEISIIDGRIISLSQKMIEAMHENSGIGLAAPQIGISERLIVIDIWNKEKPDEIIILANPELLEAKGESILEEGCLSVPEIKEEVKRPQKVLIKGIGLDEKEKIIEATDILARVFCHEIDHLNGKFFIDHLSLLKRQLIKRKLRKILNPSDYYHRKK